MFTLIGYRPNSADYCRGCLVASYSSDFVFQTGMSADDVVAAAADLQAYERSAGEVGYEWKILNPQLGSGVILADHTLDYEDEDPKVDEVRTAVMEKVTDILRQRKEAQAADRAAEKNKLIEAQRKADLRTLEALKARYPDEA